MSRNHSNNASLTVVGTGIKFKSHLTVEAEAYIKESDIVLYLVCFVLYGHPTIFAKPALDAVLQARNEGFYAKILPGISAEDCLFADLLINPGASGCQSYEATDFLIYQRKIDTSCHVILWQVGIIGALGYSKEHDNTCGSNVLSHALAKYYERDHQIILYEAAQYPHLEPRINISTLNELPHADCTQLTTLCSPPIRRI